MCAAGVSVSPTSGLITGEDGGGASFTVVLDSEPTADVVFTFASSDTTEGTVSPSTITFTAADYNVVQTVTVSGVNDNVDDGDIIYTISETTSSSDVNYNGISVSDVTVTNTDDDTGTYMFYIIWACINTHNTDQFTILFYQFPILFFDISYMLLFYDTDGRWILNL